MEFSIEDFIANAKPSRSSMLKNPARIYENHYQLVGMCKINNDASFENFYPISLSQLPEEQLELRFGNRSLLENSFCHGLPKLTSMQVELA